MKDELVSFEVAKLAKEKGFNEKCSHYYIHKFGNSEYLKRDHGKLKFFTGSLDENDMKNYMCFRNSSKGQPHIIIAPTQSLLQKWLRELKDIDVIITPDGNSQHKLLMRKYFVTLWIYKDGVNVQPLIIKDKSIIYFNKYEHALEAGLLEALKIN